MKTTGGLMFHHLGREDCGHRWWRSYRSGRKPETGINLQFQGNQDDRFIIMFISMISLGDEALVVALPTGHSERVPET
jgi:hypothetical protein